MVGTRSPADEEAEGGSAAGAAAATGAAAAPSPSTFVNEATLDSLVVEWLREEQEQRKVSFVLFYSAFFRCRWVLESVFYVAAVVPRRKTQKRENTKGISLKKALSFFLSLSSFVVAVVVDNLLLLFFFFFFLLLLGRCRFLILRVLFYASVFLQVEKCAKDRI